MVGGIERNNQALLVCRNVTVNGRRTSLRMEPLLWDSLNDIAERENVSLNALCTEVDDRRGEANLTAAIRVFIISYYRKAAPQTSQTLHETDGPSRLMRMALDDAIPLE